MFLRSDNWLFFSTWCQKTYRDKVVFTSHPIPLSEKCIIKTERITTAEAANTKMAHYSTTDRWHTTHQVDKECVLLMHPLPHQERCRLLGRDVNLSCCDKYNISNSICKHLEIIYRPQNISGGFWKLWTSSNHTESKAARVDCKLFWVVLSIFRGGLTGPKVGEKCCT